MDRYDPMQYFLAMFFFFLNLVIFFFFLEGKLESSWVQMWKSLQMYTISYVGFGNDKIGLFVDKVAAFLLFHSRASAITIASNFIT